MTHHSKAEGNVTSLRPVVIVTGMSGAGLSSALKDFEDLGYEAVDNLRLSFVKELIEEEGNNRPLAVSIDTRNTHFSPDKLSALLVFLREKETIKTSLLFLECSDETLQQRFTETRRRHPMAVDRPVKDGIAFERELLSSIKEEADHVIDTSDMSVHDLRRHLGSHFRLDTEAGLSVFVTSFSYRHGLPREADLVFDVRFLRNPHWDPALRKLTGLEEEVAEYVFKDEHYQSFMSTLESLVMLLLPRYQQEGKSYLTIAIGCTGGRHRSVVVTEQLATSLAKRGYIVGIGHRDIDRLKKNSKE